MSLARRIARFFGKDNRMTNIAAGNPAPDFSLKSLDGKNYSLKDLLHQGPVVAVFFKVSCPVCQFTAPFLERLYKRYGGSTATFLGISQDNAAATKKFMQEYGLTFPVALDPDGYPVSNAYGLTNVPTIFFIDTDGTAKIISLGFEKQALEDIARTVAERQKLTPAALFRPDESVPAHKPG
jgi:cytochrome c biogenesis protein CcmG, thiol:disulfide interchange protein DsbE